MDEGTRLALAARAGDPAALDGLVGLCYGPVWRFCAGMVGTSDAEDLAQDTFARALTALAGFRGGSSATTWLIGIPRHACLDHLRAARRRERRHREGGPQLARGADPADRAAAADLLRRLAPDRREALLLTQVLGFTYAQAAAVCRCPVATIRSRVARARSDLIELMGGADEPAREVRAA